MNIALKPEPVLSLPADWYHRADIFERERQNVFAREWQFLGPLSALANPGDYIAAEMVKAFLVSSEYRARFAQ